MPDARVIPIGGDDRPRRASAADAVAAGASRASGERARRRAGSPLLDGTPTPVEAAAPARPARRRTAKTAAPPPATPPPEPVETVLDEPETGAPPADDPGAARVGAQGRGALAFLRRRLTGDYEVDEFGFDPELTDHVLLAAAAAAVRALVPGRGPRASRTSRPTAARWSSPTTPAPSPLDALMTQLALLDHHPAHRHLRMLGADLVFQTPGRQRAGAQERHHAGLQRRRGAAARQGRAGRGLAGGLQGHRQAVLASATSCSGSAGAASCRRRCKAGVPIVPCSIVGAEEIYPILGNVKTLARLLGLPYVPVTPTFPWLGPLGADPAAQQVDHRVRRADRTPTATAAARPTTRCWSSTSPTRCARRSSTRSTGC